MISYVVVGQSSDNSLVVVGNFEGKPVHDKRVGDKLLSKCRDDHGEKYEFQLLEVQRGPITIR